VSSESLGRRRNLDIGDGIGCAGGSFEPDLKIPVDSFFVAFDRVDFATLGFH